MSDWNESLREQLFSLCDISAVSGFPARKAAYVQELFGEVCDETEMDRLGNIVGIRYCGKPGAKLVLLDAHLDQIGFVVTEVLPNGFLRFKDVGGVDPRMLLGCEVIIEMKDRQIPGIVSCTPPHLLKIGEESNVVPVYEMVIDTGLLDAKPVIAVGTPFRFASRGCALYENVVASPSLDDRAGVLAIVEAMRRLNDSELSVNVAVAATVQEEITALGAQTTAFRLQPDYAIAVDVSHAKTPDSSADTTFKFGGGVMIGMGPNCNTALTNALIETAKAEKMDYQLEVMEGSTGTNAWEMQIAGLGAATAVLSVPLRYMHTPIETITGNDLGSVASLLYHFLKNFSGEASK